MEFGIRVLAALANFCGDVLPAETCSMENAGMLRVQHYSCCAA